MARRRNQLDPFGASLLDMMCCGLGAAIIVFVLRQMAVAQAIVAADASAVEARQEAARDERAAASSRAQMQRDAKRLRDAKQVSMFGLPPLGGNVCVLVDCSGSMASDAKLEVAKDCITAMLRGNTTITRLRVSSFTTREVVVFDEELPEAGTLRRTERLQAAIDAARAFVASGDTDVPAVLSTAIAAMQARGGGTITLMTDGITPQESGGVLEKARSARSDARITTHCVGLFRRAEVTAISPVEGRFPGQLLREVALAGGGVFVGVPVPLATRP